MALTQITRQACLVYRAVRNAPAWTTARLVEARSGVTIRTTRGLLKSMADANLLEMQAVHGGFRYKVRDPMSSDAKVLATKIHEAEKVFGLLEAA